MLHDSVLVNSFSVFRYHLLGPVAWLSMSVGNLLTVSLFFQFPLTERVMDVLQYMPVSVLLSLINLSVCLCVFVLHVCKV